MNNIVIFSLITMLFATTISLSLRIERLKSDVDLIKMKLNTISKHVDLPDPTNKELKIIVLELISKGEKIKAIKEYSLATGAGLLEAKQYIDHLSK